MNEDFGFIEGTAAAESTDEEGGGKRDDSGELGILEKYLMQSPQILQEVIRHCSPISQAAFVLKPTTNPS